MIARPFTFLFLLFFVLGCGAIDAQNAVPQPSTPPAETDLDSYRAQYSKVMSDLEADRAAKDAQARANYTATLDRLQKDVSAHGNLDGALAIKAERDRVAASREPTADERKNFPQMLVAYRTRFEQERQTTQSDDLRKEEVARKRYVAVLQELQTRYTQRNELEKAVAVRSELTSFAARNPEAGLPPAAAAPPVTGEPALPLPFSPTLGGKAEGVPNGGRDLLSSDDRHKWKSIKGDWKFRNRLMVGSGESAIDFTDAFTPPFSLHFTINVLDGMRPRVMLGKISFANEGFDTTLGLYPLHRDVKLFHYQRKTAYKVEIKVNRDSSEMYVDDKLVMDGPGAGDHVDKLEFCAGDGWSKGRVEYGEITVSPAHSM